MDEFTLVSVEEKTRGRKARRSKYDAMIDQFMERGSPVMRVDGVERSAAYLSLVIGKRIERRGLADKIKASCAGGCLYLERL
ncbi:MAG: hypothetical protein L0213_11190 [Candidatus Dadabacteria bacterium]|nr:hypothetical protein [Candidatus Dadabacteria bacterium]